jgi:phosphoribosyl-ATP pyrophosphohydrolase
MKEILVSGYLILFLIGGIVGAILYKFLIIRTERKYTMNFININTDLKEQQRKCIDELCEFIVGVNKHDTENIIEEFFDVIQAMLGIIKILGIQSMLLHGLVKHNEKLKNRGWKFTKID